jgi:RNA 2',3'-cyclic 3'-phosphodiesterase
MGKRRLFYALPVDIDRAEAWHAAFGEALERCAGVQCAARLRRVPAGEWHLTLAFLGMTPEDCLPQLAAEVGRRVASCSVPRVVELAGGVFPERGDPRVLWFGPRVNASATGALEQLASAVRAGVEAVLPGSLPPAEVFRAHLTGSRVPRGVRGPSREGRLAFEGERLDCDWRPAEVRLYESRSSAEGPRYRVLDSHPVGAGDAADGKLESHR